MAAGKPRIYLLNLMPISLEEIFVVENGHSLGPRDLDDEKLSPMNLITECESMGWLEFVLVLKETKFWELNPECKGSEGWRRCGAYGHNRPNFELKSRKTVRNEFLPTS